MEFVMRAFVSSLTPVGISEYDFGVRLLVTQDGTLPTFLPGERRLPVVLGVKNIGPQTWKRDSVRIGYHWYYQDGSEFLWEDETTAIPHDLPSGEGVNNLLTYVTAPPCDGNYFLVWDVKFGDTWASTSAVSHVLDEQVHPVRVTGGRLVFADLTKSYNVDGVTDLTNLNGGDFDGKGRTFPAAVIPPFTDDGVVPAGIWQPYDRTGPEIAHGTLASNGVPRSHGTITSYSAGASVWSWASTRASAVLFTSWRLASTPM